MDLRPFAYRGTRERQQRELELVRDNGELSPAQLHAVLDVSMETLRRDLRTLESQGLIRRSYGRVAPALIDKLGESQIIYIDEGYTEELIAQRLPSDRRIAVVTPALPVATMLAPRPNIQVMILGG